MRPACLSERVGGAAEASASSDCWIWSRCASACDLRSTPLPWLVRTPASEPAASARDDGDGCGDDPEAMAGALGSKPDRLDRGGRRLANRLHEPVKASSVVGAGGTAGQMALERGALELGDLAVGGKRRLESRPFALDRQTVHVFSRRTRGSMVSAGGGLGFALPALSSRPMRVLVLVATALTLAAAVAGCGSGGSDEKLTEQQYANAVVNRFLRPVSKDLGVLNRLNTADVRYYVVTGNKTTLAILRKHLGDLARCTKKLDAIGVPTEDSEVAPVVDEQLRAACTHYEPLARTILTALPHLSSGRQPEVTRAESSIRAMFGESRAGSMALQKALTAMAASAAFQKAGVRPSG